jgi:hypothetical protein
MPKKRKMVIISALAAAVILTVGLVGGIAYADSSTSTDSAAKNPQMVLADKVASILGLDASEVEAAFTQAQKEIKAERLDNQLQKLVDDGKISQDEAAQYKTWLESRPDIDIPGLDSGRGGRGGHGGMMGPGMGTPPGAPPDSATGTSSGSE